MLKLKRRATGGLLGLAILLGGCSTAEVATTGPPQHAAATSPTGFPMDGDDGSEPYSYAQRWEPAPLTGPDAAFAQKAAAGSDEAIALGQLAVERAHTEAIRNYGHQLVLDHSRFRQEIHDLASRKGVTLIEPRAAREREERRLARLSPLAFDEAFTRMMEEDHKQDLLLFQRQANDGEDLQLRSWAARQLPTLKHHLQLIQEIQATQ